MLFDCAMWAAAGFAIGGLTGVICCLKLNLELAGEESLERELITRRYRAKLERLALEEAKDEVSRLGK